VNQSQTNLMTLAAAVRGDKQALAAVCATAQKLNLPSPKRQPKQPSASNLQNYIRKINPQDLHQAIAQYGTTSVFNRVNAASILETAAQKFAEQAMKKAGGK
jgi:hypothetical protein